MASKKQPSSNSKTRDALEALAFALKRYKAGKEPEAYRYAALAKTFEVAVEYLWKDMKRYIEDEGMDVASPKEAVRQAARLSLIDKPDRWMHFINARNASVHDYFTVSKADFVRLAAEFQKSALRVHNKIGG